MDLAGRINGALRRLPPSTIYVVGTLWAAWLFWLGLTGQLGAEPINRLEREYGAVALKLLVLGLAVTPLRNWTGVSLIRFRRAIGVTAFFFVLAHFLVFAVLDVQSLGRVWTEVVKRPYVTVGMLALVLLIPLAVTSNNAMLRRLGPLRWRALHKLTYPVALLAALHYIWLVKGWPLEPFVYAGIILGLLGARIRWNRGRAAAKA